MKKIKWGPIHTDNYGKAKVGCVKLSYRQEGASGKTWVAYVTLCCCGWSHHCESVSKKGKQMKSIKAVRDDAVRLAYELLFGIADDLKDFE